jgi:hypothetical protein
MTGQKSENFCGLQSFICLTPYKICKMTKFTGEWRNGVRARRHDGMTARREEDWQDNKT